HRDLHPFPTRRSSDLEYNRQTFNQLGNQFSRGQFSSQPIGTALETKDPNTGKVTLSGGDALADFLLGNLYQSTVAVAVANANYVDRKSTRLNSSHRTI